MNTRFLVLALFFSFFFSCSSDSPPEERNEESIIAEVSEKKSEDAVPIPEVSEEEKEIIEDKVSNLIETKLEGAPSDELTKKGIDLEPVSKEVAKERKSNIEEKKKNFEKGIIASQFYTDVICCKDDFTSECCCKDVLTYYETKYNLYLNDAKYAVEISELDTKDKIVQSCLKTQSWFKEKIDNLKKQKPKRLEEEEDDDWD